MHLHDVRVQSNDFDTEYLLRLYCSHGMKFSKTYKLFFKGLIRVYLYILCKNIRNYTQRPALIYASETLVLIKKMFDLVAAIENKVTREKLWSACEKTVENFEVY